MDSIITIDSIDSFDSSDSIAIDTKRRTNEIKAKYRVLN